mgnify:CR=1 FL=1
MKKKSCFVFCSLNLSGGQINERLISQFVTGRNKCGPACAGMIICICPFTPDYYRFYRPLSRFVAVWFTTSAVYEIL